MKFFTRKKGFTLIELLVVIAIIGILASIVLVSLGDARKKARDARRQSDIRQISLAMEMCLDDSTCGGSGTYCTMAAGSTTTTLTRIGGLGPCNTAGGPNYLNPVPSDPQSPTQEYTSLTGTADQYCVYATLEGGGFFAASNKGTRELTAAPTELAPYCW